MKPPRWLGKLLYGGTSSLNAGEESLVAVIAAALDDKDRRILEEQIGLIWLVQRPQPGRITIISYHDREQVPSFDDDAYEACLAELGIRVEGGKRRRVKLMLHRGCLHSFEGSIPEGATPASDCQFTLWPQRRSTVAAAIDWVEHGDQNAQQGAAGQPATPPRVGD